MMLGFERENKNQMEFTFPEVYKKKPSSDNLIKQERAECCIEESRLIFCLSNFVFKLKKKNANSFCVLVYDVFFYTLTFFLAHFLTE